MATGLPFQAVNDSKDFGGCLITSGTQMYSRRRSQSFSCIGVTKVYGETLDIAVLAGAISILSNTERSTRVGLVEPEVQQVHPYSQENAV